VNKSSKNNLVTILIILLATLLIVAFLANTVWSTKAESNALPQNAVQAQALAEVLFHRELKNTITTYSIDRVSVEDMTEWSFIIVGTGDFARPGYFWTVRINRATGQWVIEHGA
jgi:hypothetical protein